MALPDVTEQNDKKPPDTGRDKKEKLFTKVIVRRLPPSMDSETFLNQISPVPPYDYFYMVKGDASLGENSFARAYINFTNPNDIYDFKEKFDNYVFLDNAGHEYPAVVEFAAFQKIPKKRNKVRVDPKVATIESDPFYQEFVEMINRPPEQEEKPEYTYQINTDNKNDKNDTTTPLLEYIRNKKAEKMRIREERREERRRKEFERKKFRDDDRKRRYDEKSPIKGNKYTSKTVSSKEQKPEDGKRETEEGETDKASAVDNKPVEKEVEGKYEKPSSSYYKGRDKRYDDRRKDVRSKYPPKKEYFDKREYKSRRDDYRDRDYRSSKYDDYKKEDPKAYPKKIKKYSERREERKIEAQKAEQRRLEQIKEVLPNEGETSKVREGPTVKEEKSDNSEAAKEVESTEKVERSKENDGQSQRRIRNKDRPTIAIYRPGMLSKRKQVDGETEKGDVKKE